MDAAQRAAYLEALGVTAWQLRQPLASTVMTDSENRLDNAHSSDDGSEPLSPPPLPIRERGTLESESTSECDTEWSTLSAAVAACQACELHCTRTQTVFGVGNRQADWLVIGEAPGEQEDLRGEPFVGRAGQLLDEMLRAAGFAREQVYIANILKCRPPANRDPKPDEAAACEGYLLQQIALVQPKLILAVGRIAAQNLLKTDTPIGRLRGRVHDYHGVPLVVTYHPAYLLRSLTEKRKAWDDLRLALNIAPVRR